MGLAGLTDMAAALRYLLGLFAMAGIPVFGSRGMAGHASGRPGGDGHGGRLCTLGRAIYRGIATVIMVAGCVKTMNVAARHAGDGYRVCEVAGYSELSLAIQRK